MPYLSFVNTVASFMKGGHLVGGVMSAPALIPLVDARRCRLICSDAIHVDFKRCEKYREILRKQKAGSQLAL
jgi:hypothetical protein